MIRRERMGSVNGAYWTRLLVHEDIFILTPSIHSRAAGTRFSRKYRTRLPRLSSTIPGERSGLPATIVDVHPKQATLSFLHRPPSSVPARSRDILWPSALASALIRTCLQKRRSTSPSSSPGSASTSTAHHIPTRTQHMTRTAGTSIPPRSSSSTVAHRQWCPPSVPRHPR